MKIRLILITLAMILICISAKSLHGMGMEVEGEGLGMAVPDEDQGMEVAKELVTVYLTEEETAALEEEMLIISQRQKNLDQQLRTAIVTRNWENIVDLLIKGADPNTLDAHGNTVLHVAAMPNAWSLCPPIEPFIQSTNLADPIFNSTSSRIDPNIRNKEGLTPLLVATNDSYPPGNPHLVKSLLRHGANPNATDPKGNSALHYRAGKTRGADLILLLEYGANPNKQNDQGDTPLHLAVNRSGKFAYSDTNARIILAKDGNPNIGDRHGRTSLHLAAMLGCTKLAEILLMAGASPQAIALDGKTPLELAVERERREQKNDGIVRMLSSARRQGDTAHRIEK